MGQGILPGCFRVYRRRNANRFLILKPAPSYPGYLAGDDGSVWSVRDRRKTEPYRLAIREHETTRSVARPYVNIRHRRADGKTYSRGTPVYKVVADAFHGPSNGLSVDHIDGDCHNDRPENLRYISMYENNSLGHSKGETMDSKEDWEDF